MHVVAAAIVRDGRVLAARRPLDKRHGGKWELPGGKVEPGESEAEAIVREIREELQCEVQPVARLGEYAGDGIRLCAWRCAIIAGEPTPTEHIGLQWVEPERLGELDWTQADVPLLGLIFG